MNDLNEFMDFLKRFLNTSGNTEAHLTLGDYTLDLAKDETGYSMEIHSVESEEEDYDSFDDTYIKELVKDYKNNIEALDDNTFLEVLDKMKDELDIKEFDDLLELEEYNEKNAGRVVNFILESNEIIRKHLQNKIQSLIEVYEKFSR